MKNSQIFLLMLLSFATAVGTTYMVNPPRHGTQSPITSATPAATPKTSYDRVIRSGVLRCGYEYWDGAIMRDLQTNELHGAWVDILNAFGEATGLKIEWTSQVGWADVGAALKSGKIDAMCAGMWTSAAKAKEISFSTPLAYQALEVIVRDDDHRFDANYEGINDTNIKIAVIENDNSDFIARQDFPLAQKDSLGSLNGTDSELMMQVLNDKADVTFTTAGLWQQFNKTNPGKLRRLDPSRKLRVYGLALAIDNDDPRLLSLVNAGVAEIQNSGILDRILDKSEKEYPDLYIKALKAFP